MTNKLLTAALWLGLFALAAYGTHTAQNWRPHGFSYKGQRWLIKYVPVVPLGRGYIGETQFDTYTIYIGKEGTSCQLQQVILLHELGHVVVPQPIGEEVAERATFEEFLEGRLDVGLQAIARDNPEVWGWIGEGCR